MLTKQIDVKEVQTRLQELLAQIALGEEWILTDGNKPIARLVPIASRVAGYTQELRGRVSTSMTPWLTSSGWAAHEVAFGHAYVYLVG